MVAFELFQMRAMLLVFANTFEYFFIAYEAVRTRWDPRRLGLSGWVVVAAAIWVCVKLPQEYWIHVAQLDMTDTLARPRLGALAVRRPAARPRGGPLVRGAARGCRSRTGRCALAADPLPEEMDTAAEQAAWRPGSSRLWSC